jgi:phosphate transport system ATP-binding protein
MDIQVAEAVQPKAEVQSLNFYYGGFQALKNVNMPVFDRKVTALIGPSGCGKSTLLRCFNRMHDLYPGNRYEGGIRLHPDDTNLLAEDVDPIEVRMRVSMVFQKPNPFPKSVFENVAYGLRVRGVRSKSLVEEKVEAALRGAALWDEVKDRPVRRAYLRPRSDRHRQHRGTGIRAQAARHDSDRHPQHAAGGARLGLYRLHVYR